MNLKIINIIMKIMNRKNNKYNFKIQLKMRIIKIIRFILSFYIIKTIKILMLKKLSILIIYRIITVTQVL